MKIEEEEDRQFQYDPSSHSQRGVPPTFQLLLHYHQQKLPFYVADTCEIRVRTFRAKGSQCVESPRNDELEFESSLQHCFARYLPAVSRGPSSSSPQIPVSSLRVRTCFVHVLLLTEAGHNGVMHPHYH